MSGIFCITFYFTISLFLYVLSKKSFRCKSMNNMDTVMKNKENLKWWVIIVFSILFVLLNIYCTEKSVNMGGDRVNYLYDFMGWRKSSVGLDFIFSIIKEVSNDFKHSLYLSTFLCCLIMFYAFRKMEDATPQTMLFLLSTDFVFTTFVNLKQCYANVFAALFFSLIVKEKTIKRDVKCLFLALLASIFHSVGFFLFPIYIYFLILEKKSKYIQVNILFVFICVIFAPQIAMIVARLIAVPLPQLSVKIIEYFGEQISVGGESSSFAFLKGFPYYMLLFFGMYRRKYFVHKVKNYNKYLFLTALGGMFFLMSIHSYWMSRFTAIFYLPMGVLYSIILKDINRNDRIFIKVLINGVMLFFLIRSLILIYVNYGGF